MIGVFDSGHGGLTILRALREKFPQASFIYLGDHANAPYGNRSSEQVVDLTRKGVEALYKKGCRLVILGCNTATSIACRQLQQDWLPNSEWQKHNVLGIIAPTVEVATQTPWGVTEPQYPQKYNSDKIALFATQRTIGTGVYEEEIGKRCPRVEVIATACPKLAGAIESGADRVALNEMIKSYVDEMLLNAGEYIPHWAILGCTHFPLVEDLFAKHLPHGCRLLSQPEIVADSLEHYLARHPHYLTRCEDVGQTLLLTTGDVLNVESQLVFSWPERPHYQGI